MINIYLTPCFLIAKKIITS